MIVYIVGASCSGEILDYVVCDSVKVAEDVKSALKKEYSSLHIFINKCAVITSLEQWKI